MSSLIIKSTHGSTQVELREHDADFFMVTIRDVTLQASAGVYHYGGDGIDKYFADLSENWQGWSGPKEWESLEGTLKLEATADGKGHITLGVQLDYGTPYYWRIRALLILEAGQLERISKDARKFAVSIGSA